MTTKTKRTTIYLEPDLHKALRMKAVTASRSVSELVNEAVKKSFAADAEDLEVFETRANEQSISYDEMIKKLKKDGRI